MAILSTSCQLSYLKNVLAVEIDIALFNISLVNNTCKTYNQCESVLIKQLCSILYDHGDTFYLFSTEMCFA